MGGCGVGNRSKECAAHHAWMTPPQRVVGRCLPLCQRQLPGDLALPLGMSFATVLAQVRHGGWISLVLFMILSVMFVPSNVHPVHDDEHAAHRVEQRHQCPHQWRERAAPRVQTMFSHLIGLEAVVLYDPSIFKAAGIASRNSVLATTIGVGVTKWRSSSPPSMHLRLASPATVAHRRSAYSSSAINDTLPPLPEPCMEQ
ncbi:Os12g0183600 [Oryza sativa Japonica Group]|uniref:Os12g0183600 protein n=1 Tax=Oryza sativa subsp. japonica TaxID=39947 RepID=A0A0P0Y7R7_ORYSJ|nr:Os12g0183600 [Oryza sativa Japonica Group]